MTSTSVISKPLITERATALQALGKYVFQVNSSATKNEVKKAVKAIYKVDAISVNIVNRPPKPRRFRGTYGVKPGYKKAIVTLRAGQTIDTAR